jgi:hypothetical protein
MVESAHFFDGICIFHVLDSAALVLLSHECASGLIVSASKHILRQRIFGFAGSTQCAGLA